MIISVANQKGGVGKTTTVVNLAAYFAAKGKKVLVIDCDVQGHCARALGVAKGNALFRLVAAQEPLWTVIVEARPGMHLITSDKWSEKIKMYVSERNVPGLYIATLLTKVSEQYDMTFIDLAPGSDVLHVGALIASDYFIIPAAMEFLALDGVVEVIKTARGLTEIPSVQPPKLIGVLPTMYERRPNKTEVNLKALAELVGIRLVLPPIPKDVRVDESISRGMTLWEYAPETAALAGYANGSTVRNSAGKTGGYLHLAEIVEGVVGHGN